MVIPVDENDNAESPALTASMSGLAITTQTTTSQSQDTLPLPRWRQPLQHRTKTVGVALIMCLHIGVDPPDLIRPASSGDSCNAAARMECWIDPLSMAPDKARETIAKTLQQQYEYWQPRARYKTAIDPTVEEVKRVVSTLRRGAKQERLLVHYNGHGVPRPTRGGELWLFNKQFTQYIPMHIRDLMAVAMEGQGPAMFVFDCSSAGHLHQAVIKQQQQPHAHDVMVLSACQAGEQLPVLTSSMDGSTLPLPMDLFTACLTTPMEVALRVFPRETGSFLPPDSVKKSLDLPGRLNDRSTVLGELNWILTAICDTIAWQLLDDHTFQHLFRQDTLVASLYKNFLLACRVMRQFGCTPLSYPLLPVHLIATHKLWHCWSFEVDRCLSLIHSTSNSTCGNSTMTDTGNSNTVSMFFAEHRLAFESYLDFDCQMATELLPIMLQLLLSQQHRPAALSSFNHFMARHRDGVEQSLTVGLFPYILKLLQSAAVEIRVPLVWCWLRVLRFDVGTVRSEWAKDAECLRYFKDLAFDDNTSTMASGARDVESQVVSLAVLCMYYYQSPDTLITSTLSDEHLHNLVKQLKPDDHQVSVWKVLLLGVLLHGHGKYRQVNYKPLIKLLKRSDDPGLRANNLLRRAAVYCLGVLLRYDGEHLGEIINTILSMVTDEDTLVREQVLIALSNYISIHTEQFTIIASHWNTLFTTTTNTSTSTDISVWQAVLCLAMDPDDRLGRQAGHVVDEVKMYCMFRSASTDCADVLFVQDSSDTVDGQVKLHGLHHDDNLDPHSNTSTDQVQLETVLPMKTTILESMLDDFCVNGCNRSGDNNTIKDDNHQNDAIIDILLEDAREDISKAKRPLAIVDNQHMVTAACFATPHHVLCCGDVEGKVSVWQYDNHNYGTITTSTFNRPSMTLKARFSNGQSSGPIRSVCHHDNTMMLSSTDGAIRLWRDYVDTNSTTRCVSAWTVNDPHHHGPMMCVNTTKEWLCFTEQQDTSVSMWDLNLGCIVGKRSFGALIVDMAEHIQSKTMVVALSNGTISMMDERVRELTRLTSIDRDNMLCRIGVFDEHYLMASTGKKYIHLLDTRRPSPHSAATIWQRKLDHDCKVCTHPRLPMFAASRSTDHAVSFYYIAGGDPGDTTSEVQCTNTVRYHEGLLGRPLARTSVMTVHPDCGVYCVCGHDGTVSLYS